ncbi:DNA-binding transcriptional MerR regulator [Haloactinospora alba]|uniref:DNA-binding transcriptional MerR regulator n=1 Tax=Haloactinospora alba TaxID=405555 RepID=A0A543N9L9_9ACTN|nr:MerR family transcriptional regulator [Haloactinospora alba]TQN28535.1 DNA-binding transcriptional MerR regulator [Haloactinospora alba]
MRIGELARRTGVSERSLRYYEQQGLVSSERTAGGHREFGEETVETVERIQCLFAAGLCSSTIVHLLPCMRDREQGLPAPDLVGNLEAERDRIDGMMDRLVTSRRLLDELITESSAHPDSA